MEFYEAIKNRRTRYAITDASPVSDARLEEIVRTAVQYAPSSFHSQSSRAVLLLDAAHAKLWSIVLETLRARVPAERFAATEKKIASFAAGHGTVLYFEDMDVVEGLQKSFADYAENFPVWSNQSAGMLQYSVWTALSAEGLGASLQHYNPIIDAEVKRTFALPESWKLLAQMPFGTPAAEPQPLVYKDLAARVLVKEKAE